MSTAPVLLKLSVTLIVSGSPSLVAVNVYSASSDTATAASSLNVAVAVFVSGVGVRSYSIAYEAIHRARRPG